MDLVEELAEFTGRDIALVRERCKYAFVELAWQWEAMKDDPIKYYKELDLYNFDLTNYQTILRARGFSDWLKTIFGRPDIEKVLDFGGGIGEYTILAMEAGKKVHYMEILDSKTREYAEWRFAKRGLKPDVLDEFGNEKYDLIVAMDVFEHIPEPDSSKLIEEMAHQTRFLIANLDLPFNSFYPQHITLPTFPKHFNKLIGDMWESKYL